jgi:hypothetical protein
MGRGVAKRQHSAKSGIGLVLVVKAKTRFAGARSEN